jgi:hypothetical protein
MNANKDGVLPARVSERQLINGDVQAKLVGPKGEVDYKATFMYGVYDEKIYVNSLQENEFADYLWFFISNSLGRGRYNLPHPDIEIRPDNRFGLWRPAAGFLELKSVESNNYTGNFEVYEDTEVGIPAVTGGKFTFVFADT